MIDPATTAGLALAVVPLMISALENWEYTFRPIIIFAHRYRSEVENLQNELKVQAIGFANECCFLLESVSDHGSDMINNLQHWSWQDPRLEGKLQERLNENYEACRSSLQLIDGTLKDILKDTKTLEILLQQVS